MTTSKSPPMMACVNARPSWSRLEGQLPHGRRHNRAAAEGRDQRLDLPFARRLSKARTRRSQSRHVTTRVSCCPTEPHLVTDDNRFRDFLLRLAALTALRWIVT
jgi:hypothetical protein